MTSAEATKLFFGTAATFPLIAELIQDRNGEKKQDKLLDGIVLIIAYLVLTFGAIVAGVQWWALLLWALGLRLMFFDYIINIILYRRGIIEWPEARKWWSYLGKTAEMDQEDWWANLHWLGRLAIRTASFAGTLLLYTYHG